MAALIAATHAVSTTASHRPTDGTGATAAARRSNRCTSVVAYKPWNSASLPPPRAARRRWTPAKTPRRPGRGDRAQLPGPDHALRAGRGLGRTRASTAAVSAFGATTSFPTRTRRSRSSPIATAGTVGALRRRAGLDAPHYILNPDGDAARLGSKVTLELAPGDVVSYRTCGGGGYGPPFERDPELVLRGCARRQSQRRRARDPSTAWRSIATGRVDEAETARLRAALRSD